MLLIHKRGFVLRYKIGSVGLQPAIPGGADGIYIKYWPISKEADEGISSEPELDLCGLIRSFIYPLIIRFGGAGTPDIRWGM